MPSDFSKLCESQMQYEFSLLSMQAFLGQKSLLGRFREQSIVGKTLVKQEHRQDTLRGW